MDRKLVQRLYMFWAVLRDNTLKVPVQMTMFFEIKTRGVEAVRL